jgi:predicted phosphodiesterase
MFALIVSDLHLTDRPSDEYRWKVFDQLAELSKEHGANDLYILGDITEFKDYHSSALVNRIVDTLYTLRRNSRINMIRILKGNHDGVDKDTPYFRFMRRIPWCEFYVIPTFIEEGKDTILMLPHTTTPVKDWEKIEFGNATHIFFHGTVTGAVSESGHVLTGIPIDMLKGLRSLILAGDIHVPQKVGGVVEYVGAPYHIRFGDSFEPRAVLLKGKNVLSMPLHNIRKPTLHCTGTRFDEGFSDLGKGDQVRVVIELSESELGDFHKIKQEAAKKVAATGAILSKVQMTKVVSKKPVLKTSVKKKSRTPIEELHRYCKRFAVPDHIQEVGESFLGDTEHETS